MTGHAHTWALCDDDTAICLDCGLTRLRGPGAPLVMVSTTHPDLAELKALAARFGVDLAVSDQLARGTCRVLTAEQRTNPNDPPSPLKETA